MGAQNLKGLHTIFNDTGSYIHIYISLVSKKMPCVLLQDLDPRWPGATKRLVTLIHPGGVRRIARRAVKGDC